MNKLKNVLLKGPQALFVPLACGIALACSNNVLTALYMGICLTCVLLFTTLVGNLFTNLISDEFKAPFTILVAAGFTTIFYMLAEAFLGDLVNQAGLYVSCLAVSVVCVKCGKVVKTSTFNPVVDALVTGVFFTLIVCVCAVFREVLGNATFAGMPIAFLNDFKVSTLAGAFGGYVVLAIILAVVNKLGSLIKDEEVTE